MVNRTNYSYFTYQPDKATAILLASLVGISLITWIIQSIKTRFQPRRLVILLLIAHLTIFIELVLRASVCSKTFQTGTIFIVSAILLAVCQRLILVADKVFLIQANDPNSRRSRIILITSILAVAISGILLGVASKLSTKSHTVKSGFRLRRIAAAMLLSKAIVFYPLWYFTRTTKSTSPLAIVLLTISSIGSLIIGIFVFITSYPVYFALTINEEPWCYYFQLIPLAFIVCTWSIVHPQRSLLASPSKQEPLMENNNTDTHL